jgi:hypothetical protein
MKFLNTLVFFFFAALAVQAQDQNPLSESDFEKLKTEVAEQSYDSKRLRKAKELSDLHFLYAKQINAVIASLSLETNRLEYAKYAYSSVFDAENYDIVYSNFSMSASKSELKDYLSNREAPQVSGNSDNQSAVVEENVVSSSTTTTSNTTVTTTTVNKTSGPTAMNDQDFAAAKRAVGEESFESKKLSRSKQVSDANYMLCAQIVELMSVLSFESSRLEYAHYAYAKTFDQANYEIVKEGLTHSKSKDDLSDFIKKQPVADYSVKEEEIITTNDAEDEKNSDSQIGMSDEDFAHTKNLIASQSSDSKKLEKAKHITGRTNMSVAQVKAIVELFLFEDSRIDYAQFAWSKTVDKQNYDKIKEVLEKDSHAVLDEYIKNAPKDDVAEPVALISELSPDDFAELLKKIKGSALESHKLDKAKTIVDRSKVNTEQIKKIIELFTLEETRLTYAKYAYPKTLDKENYKVVREALFKTSSKYNLDRFIKSQ